MASVAVETGLAPSELMRDTTMLRAILAVLEERRRQQEREQARRR